MIGGAALLADGVITPSITVTSAIEGLKLFKPDIAVIPDSTCNFRCAFLYPAIRDKYCRYIFRTDYGSVVSNAWNTRYFTTVFLIRIYYRAFNPVFAIQIPDGISREDLFCLGLYSCVQQELRLSILIWDIADGRISGSPGYL